MIQWASNRKHLLVALILSWGTLRVWRTYQAGASPNFKRWMEFITYYILAWLCWPSAVLWIFWPILLFFKKMSLKSRASVTALALVLAGAGVKWTVSQNTSYESSAPLNVLHGLSIALQSLGRGLYNIILPYRVAPYYTFNSWLNWIGAIGLLLIVVLLLKYKHQQGWKIKWGDPALMLFLLSALLFVPNAMVFLGYYEFVWADRYIYTPLPYLAAAIGAFWTSHAPIFKKLSVPPVWSRGAIALVLAVYVVLSWKLPASWETDKALFNRCALVEKAPKCIYLAVEKNYDINGCQDLSPLLKIAREARAISKVDFAFSSQLPLYEAICITQMRPTAEQKWAELESLKSVYSVTESLAVGEVWVHIQQRDLDSAFKTAQRTYLNGQRKFSDVSPKIVNVILGQMEALCDLSSNPQCLQSLNEFKERIRSAPRNELQMTWARNRTFEAYFTGR